MAKKADLIRETISQLKEEISLQKKGTQSIKDLVKKDIDRDYSINLWDLSDKELDFDMATHLSFLNEDIDPRPSAADLTSHRRFFGRFIVRFKRFLLKITSVYSNALLDRQRRFNDQSVRYKLATFIRFRQLEDRLAGLEENLKEMQENLEILAETRTRADQADD
jgi:hypothetical protein